MPTFRTTTTIGGSRRLSGPPNLVVGWASGLVQVWPNEDPAILPATDVRARPHTREVLATPAAVLDVLAAADGQDPTTYRRTYASEAGAVLALTHHSEDELLTASVEVEGALRPSRVLAVIHRAMDPDVAGQWDSGQHLLAS